MTIINSLQKINLLNWFGIYQPLIDRWRKKNLQILQLKLSERFVDPVPYRIEFRIDTYSERRFISGYGEDTSETRAYEKAVCELFEREKFIENKSPKRLTTNGVAAHRFTMLAKSSAKAELIERDAFLRHWLTKTPFVLIEQPKDTETLKILDSIHQANHCAYFFYTFLGAKPTAIVVIENLGTHGFLIGSSMQNSRPKALKKALREAFYNLAMERLEEIDWNKKDLYYHRNIWYERGEMPDWMRLNSIPNDSLYRPKPRFSFEFFASDPIPVIAAFSDELIDLWVGDTPDFVLERIRLEYGIEPNLALHPFP